MCWAVFWTGARKRGCDGGLTLLCLIRTHKNMRLPYADSDHWSIKAIIRFFCWQWLSRVSSRGLLYDLQPDPFQWRCQGLYFGCIESRCSSTELCPSPNSLHYRRGKKDKQTSCACGYRVFTWQNHAGMK